MKKIKNTTTLYEQVLEQIKMLIINGDYKKGDLLPSEKEIMDMTGVSRITVREALKILSETGIIQTHKGRGSVIIVDGEELLRHSADSDEYIKNFKDSTKARLFFEPEVARYVAAVATDKDIKKLTESFNEGSSDFHSVLIGIVHNKFLDEFISHLIDVEMDKTLINIIPPSHQKEVAEKLHKQHEDVLNAIKNRNPNLAYSAMKEHLLFICKTYSDFFNIFK